MQNSRSWRWLRKDFEFDTVDGQATYAFGVVTDVEDSAFITRFREWHVADRRNPPKLFLKSVGVEDQTFLSFTMWDNFKYLYETGAIQNQTSQSVHITINPRDELQLGLKPNAVYTVTGEYYRSAKVLSADADTLEMPSDYQKLVMYQAMEWYGIFESAPEIITRAKKGMKRINNQLKKNQDLQFRVGGPLA